MTMLRAVFSALITSRKPSVVEAAAVMVSRLSEDASASVSIRCQFWVWVTIPPEMVSSVEVARSKYPDALWAFSRSDASACAPVAIVIAASR